MDYVSSIAAVAAAAQKSPHVDAIELAASKAVSPIEPAAFDPRPTYTVTPGMADAMLSLADMKTQAVGAADFNTRYGHAAKASEATTAAVIAPVVAPEPTKVSSAANRNWSEDVRLINITSRKVGSDTVVEYDTQRIVAAWSAAFPDIPDRRYRGLTIADTNVMPEMSKVRAESVAAILPRAIYLLCNTTNYKTFANTHPHTHIDWIAVDSDEILLFWSKDAGADKPSVSSAATGGSASAEQD